jgi:hypothetical protein
MSLKPNYFRAILGLFLLCCKANAQILNLQAGQFLDMLRNTDGVEEKVDTLLGPPLPKNLILDLKNLKKSTKQLDLNPNILSWASSVQNPRIFKNRVNNDFFQNIFHQIEKSFPDIKLDRVNLFHAHLMQTPNDYLLVFHAFEYPMDLEPYKFELARKLNPQITPFTTNSKGYDRRNLIWSFTKNKIWRFDTSLKSKFNFLIRSPAYALYPKEVLLGNALQENLFGKNIADINYFPLEEKMLFLSLFP